MRENWLAPISRIKKILSDATNAQQFAGADNAFSSAFAVDRFDGAAHLLTLGGRVMKSHHTLKLVRVFLFAAVAGTLALAADQALAFPLTLQSLTGKLITTTQYGLTADTTTNDYTVRTSNIRQVMFLITNTVKSINPDVVLPGNVALAVDPYTKDVFLTNSEGFYFSLTASNLADFTIGEIATKFNEAGHGTVESDRVNVLLNISLIHDQNYKYYEFDIVGSGTLNVNVNKNGVATMILSVKSDFGSGIDQGSAPGMCNGSYTFKGSGIPPAGGLPYSVYWWNNLSPGAPQ